MLIVVKKKNVGTKKHSCRFIKLTSNHPIYAYKQKREKKSVFALSYHPSILRFYLLLLFGFQVTVTWRPIFCVKVIMFYFSTEKKHLNTKWISSWGKYVLFPVSHKPVKVLICFVCFIWIFITLCIVRGTGLLLKQYHTEHCAASDETRFGYWTPSTSVHLSA